MKLSPLQLASYRVLDLRVTSRMGIDLDKEDPDDLIDGMEVRLDVEHEQERDTEGASCWTVILELGFEGGADQHAPYNFRVALLAEFFCGKELPGTLDVETLVGVNGTSIAYGIARELLLTLTEKSLWGALTLPTLSFSNFREFLHPEEA